LLSHEVEDGVLFLIERLQRCPLQHGRFRRCLSLLAAA